MTEMFFFAFGIVVGVISIFPYLIAKRRSLVAEQQAATAEKARLDIEVKAVSGRKQEVENFLRDSKAWADEKSRELDKLGGELAKRQEIMEAGQKGLDARIIAYKDLQNENQILKRDLQNIDVNLHKLEIDGELQKQRQDQLDQKSTALGDRYLRETVKSVVASVGSNNYAACKQRLLNVISWCREIGFAIPPEQETALLAQLKTEFEHAVRVEFQKEEQARIKAQIREEEKLQREIDRELQQLEREREAIKAALDKALAEAKDQHSEEVQRLQARLAEAEEKSRRAISLAQQTKAGNVYIISNIGSFGRDVFKIGMTRRLEPLERVRELSSASVPFPYDVNMMIPCEDAPAMENALHRMLHKQRINKANPRKEFFKANIEAIRQVVRDHNCKVAYESDAEALEYNQSLTMTDEDAKFIEEAYDKVEDDESIVESDL